MYTPYPLDRLPQCSESAAKLLNMRVRISLRRGQWGFDDPENPGTPISLPQINGVSWHSGRGKWIVWKDVAVNTDLQRAFDEDTGDLLIGRARIVFPRQDCEVLAQGRVRVDKLVGLHDGDRVVYPELPVRHQYADLVLAPTLRAEPSQVGENLTYTVSLHGVNRPVEWTLAMPKASPEVIGVASEPFRCEVWPNTQLKDWRKFAMYLRYEAYADFAASVVHWASAEPGAGQHSLQVHQGYSYKFKDFGVHAIDGRPGFLAVHSATGETGGLFRLLPPADRNRTRQTAPTGLAIDFGTANTCFAHTRGDESAPRALELLPRHRQVAIGNKERSYQHELWFPGFVGKNSETRDKLAGCTAPLVELPSELVVRRAAPGLAEHGSVNDLAPERAAELQLFADINILTPFGSERAEARRICDRMKWASTETADKYLQKYLELSMLYALHAAESGGGNVAGDYAFHYTFPLAFNTEQETRLSHAFQVAAATVSHWSGATVSAAKACDESRAAFLALPGDPFAECDWALTIDIGGGSVDFALFNRQLFGRVGGGSIEPTAADSIHFGADLVMRTLASRPPFMQEADANDDYERRKKFIELRRNVRAHGFGGRLGLTDEQRRGLAGSARVIVSYFALIREYAARIVAGTYLNQPVNKRSTSLKCAVILVGNGWRLSEGHPESRLGPDSDAPLRMALSNEMALRIGALLAESGSQVDVKVQPFTEHMDSTEPHLSPKTLVARGALAMASRADAGDAARARGIVAPNGIDETFEFDDDGQRRRGTVPWHMQVSRNALAFPSQSTVCSTPAMPPISWDNRTFSLTFTGQDAARPARYAELISEGHGLKVSRRRPLLAEIYEREFAEGKIYKYALRDR